MTEDQLGYHDFIADVEHVNGVPVVISPYGFKKLHIEGKTYLTPMDKEEAAAVAAQFGFTDKLLPGCGKDQLGNCVPYDGCRRCAHYGGSGGWICLCAD
ncbi:hypothetical protein [Sphingomonas sp. Ag1]|uniref:hypothetical protein n=1 Tax=Sphingomonas sp. Ag1 TaxID=1642949 RepID=UPI0006225599|nr:hypothetical protein [Sphingomonas sp. Ag1]KKI17485.1 hypothetical protein XM50_14330 [Sphingomonas sp. Ag1]